MTPAQQSALETVAGRPLSPVEIVAIEPYLLARNDVQIAAILSAGRVRLIPNEIGERGILGVLGPIDGDAFLSALEAITTPEALPAPIRPYFGAIRRGVGWLKTNGLDVGSPTTRALLDALAAGGIVSAAAVEAIKAKGEQADPYHYNTISDALNIAEGRMTLGG